VLSLDLGVDMGGDSIHQDTDCAWDAVGNVYYLDYWFARWRAVSPPGPNQSSTVAPATLQIEAPRPVIITGITVSNSLVFISFTGSPSDNADAFAVLSAPSLTGPYATATATIEQVSPGVFQATLPMSGSTQFYQVQRKEPVPVQPPQVTKMAVSGGTVRIDFSGAVGDSPSAFVLLSSPTVAGPYEITADAIITSTATGLFQATTPTNGPIRFYRIQR